MDFLVASPRIPIGNDLDPLALESKPSFEAKDKVKEMKQIHGQVKARIEKVNEMYKKRANKHHS